MQHKLQLLATLLLLGSMPSLVASVKVDVQENRIFIETPPEQFTQLVEPDRARKAALRPCQLAYLHCDEKDAFVVLLTSHGARPNFLLRLYHLETVNRWIDSHDTNGGIELSKFEKASRPIDSDLAQLLYSVWTKAALMASVGDPSPLMGDGRGYSFLVWSQDTSLLGTNVNQYKAGSLSGARIEAGLLLRDLFLDQTRAEAALSKLKQRLASLDRE